MRSYWKGKYVLDKLNEGGKVKALAGRLGVSQGRRVVGSRWWRIAIFRDNVHPPHFLFIIVLPNLANSLPRDNVHREQLLSILRAPPEERPKSLENR